MIILDATNKTLEAVLSSAIATTNPQVSVSYRDITSSTYTAGEQSTNTNGTTTVTVLAAPAASTQRVVDLINIYNADTAAVTVTIKRDTGGTETILWKGTLSPEETVTYTSENGWARTVGASPGAYVDTAGVITLPNQASIPAAPAAGNVSIFSRNMAGRSMLAEIGPSGLDAILQPNFMRNRMGLWNPPGNATTVPAVLGFTALTAVGTATARNVATTNRFTRVRRLGYVSAAAAASLASVRVAAAQFTTGTGTGDGGFTFVMQFGISDAASVAGARMFMGLQASTGAATNVEPSTLVNSIGVGHGAADTNLKLYYGGSVAQTPIDLGVSFPATSLSTDWYELMLFSSPLAVSQVGYRVQNLSTGVIASGTLSGAPTAVPAATTLLTFNSYRTNNATALAVGFDLGQIYFETDY